MGKIYNTVYWAFCKYAENGSVADLVKRLVNVADCSVRSETLRWHLDDAIDRCLAQFKVE